MTDKIKQPRIRAVVFSMREIEFKITPSDNGMQIRDFLHNFGVSYSLLTKLKKRENAILLNGKFARAIDAVHTDDILKISIANSGKMPERLENENVSKIYNDEDILVLNKPALMPVHESLNHQGDTLANAAACYMESDTAFRAVYRLDRDTSGLVLIAKNELAAAKLAGRVKKDYYGICSGILNDDGTVDLPVGRERESIIKRCVCENGECAVTHYSVISRCGNNTLLKFQLETGRTHQIRVHMSHIGHALLGDTLYGDSSKLISRQALHCKTIYFTHPVTLKQMTLDCDFPEDFKGLI